MKKTTITLNQIKELDEEKFLDVCIAHAHIWNWENVDAFFYARKKAKGECQRRHFFELVFYSTTTAVP